MVRLRAADTAILEGFVASGAELTRLVNGLSESDLDLSSEPDGWTVRQIIHHVSDDGDVWSMCIKKALATPGSLVRFEGFPGNEPWAEALEFARRDVGSAVRLIRAHRRYLAQMLADFPDAWDRSVGLANAEGHVVRELTVREMVMMLRDHMLEHIETVRRTQVDVGSTDDLRSGRP